MDRLIRTYWQAWQRKRAGRKRLEPLIDRLLAEREMGGQEQQLSEAVEGKESSNKQETSSTSPDSSGRAQQTDGEEEPGEEEVAAILESVSLEEILTALMQETAKSSSRREREGIHEGLQDVQEQQELQVTSAGETSSTPSVLSLEELQDEQVDEWKQHMRRFVRQQQGGRLQIRTTSLAPRRKKIDPKATVHSLSRTAGIFQGFRYRPSPSNKVLPAEAPHLLVIADVSGSMGRYVGVILVLLACLEAVATVDSYVFSDEPTYASGLLGEGAFREQFSRLKEGASSWEYGTQLGRALQAVNRDRRYHEDTQVVLITDGGFSLLASDWADTVRELLDLHEHAGRLSLVTPNPQLVEEGRACAEALWNVERNPRDGDTLLAPQLQKTARYGLLTRYSEETLLVQSADDLHHFILRLMNPDVASKISSR